MCICWSCWVDKLTNSREEISTLLQGQLVEAAVPLLSYIWLTHKVVLPHHHLHKKIHTQTWGSHNVEKGLVNPPPLNNGGEGNKLFQLIMKRFFMCDWFFIAKCIGHYGLGFVLANVLGIWDWIFGCFCFLFLFVSEKEINKKWIEIE